MGFVFEGIFGLDDLRNKEGRIGRGLCDKFFIDDSRWFFLFVR